MSDGTSTPVDEPAASEASASAPVEPRRERIARHAHRARLWILGIATSVLFRYRTRRPR